MRSSRSRRSGPTASSAAWPSSAPRRDRSASPSGSTTAEAPQCARYRVRLLAVASRSAGPGPPPPPKRSRAWGPSSRRPRTRAWSGAGGTVTGAAGTSGQLGQADAPDLDRRGRAPVDQHQHRLGRVGPDQPREDGGRAAGQDRRPRGAGVEHDARAAARPPGATIATPSAEGWPPVTVIVSRCGRPGRGAFSPNADQARPDASGAARFAVSAPARVIQPRSRSRRLPSTSAASGTGHARRPGAAEGVRPEAEGRRWRRPRQVDRVDVLVDAARRRRRGPGRRPPGSRDASTWRPSPGSSAGAPGAPVASPPARRPAPMSSGPPGHTSPRPFGAGTFQTRVGGAGEFVATTSTRSSHQQGSPPPIGRSSAEHRATTSVGSGVRTFRPTATATFAPGATVPSPSSMRTARASHGRRSTPISTPACAGVRCGPSRTATIGTRTSWPPARSTRLEPVGASIRAHARPVRPEPSLQPPSGRRSGPAGRPGRPGHRLDHPAPGQLQDEPRIGARRGHRRRHRPVQLDGQADRGRIIARGQAGRHRQGDRPPEEDDPGQPRSAPSIAHAENQSPRPDGSRPRPPPCEPELSAATAARFPRVGQASLTTIGPRRSRTGAKIAENPENRHNLSLRRVVVRS